MGGRKPHYGVTGLPHRRSEILVRSGLEPAAERLLFLEQILDGLLQLREGFKRMARLGKRPDNLTGRVDRARSAFLDFIRPAAILILVGENLIDPFLAFLRVWIESRP
jgi:hypothetical protein